MLKCCTHAGLMFGAYDGWTNLILTFFRRFVFADIHTKPYHKHEAVTSLTVRGSTLDVDPRTVLRVNKFIMAVDP